ncbi:MAG TPA: hypothetical protein DIV82_07555 [Brevundimonas diminuta]|nr:hypothetical protein [Brevundimonas diminuta]
MAAIANHAFQAPPGLSADLLEEEGVHRALEADVNPVDRAFGQGLQDGAGVEQALVDVGDVLLVARKSVERFGHDVADFAALHSGEEGAQSGAVGDRAAGNGLVREHEHVCDALGAAGLAQKRDLIGGRPRVLQVSGVAAVEGAFLRWKNQGKPGLKFSAKRGLTGPVVSSYMGG